MSAGICVADNERVCRLLLVAGVDFVRPRLVVVVEKTILYCYHLCFVSGKFDKRLNSESFIGTGEEEMDVEGDEVGVKV